MKKGGSIVFYAATVSFAVATKGESYGALYFMQLGASDDDEKN